MPKWVTDSLKPLLDNQSLRANLSDEEAALVCAYAIDRMRCGVFMARKENEAAARERRTHAQLEIEIAAINRLLGDRDGFTRQAVLAIMIELLIVTA